MAQPCSKRTGLRQLGVIGEVLDRELELEAYRNRGAHLVHGRCRERELVAMRGDVSLEHRVDPSTVDDGVVRESFRYSDHNLPSPRCLPPEGRGNGDGDVVEGREACSALQDNYELLPDRSSR